MKKFATMAICFVLIACMVAGGSLAYLTDRDSEANVFTVGNVEIKLIEDYSNRTLTPGVDINKDVQIKNTGINDAYVWYQYAIPAALDADTASENIIHVNHAGANWDGYEDVEKYWEEGQTEAKSKDKLWQVDYDVQKNVTIGEDADKYNVYTVLYNGILKPGETTSVGMTNVYMDTAIDIDNEGNWYKVVAGEVTDLKWNHNEDKNGLPIIYVSAYAIQSEGFEDVEVAYNAYGTQWGDKGSEWANVPVVVTSAEEMYAALEAGETDVVVKGATIDENNFNGRYYTDRNIDFADCTFTANMNYMYINNATYTNCTFDCADGSAVHYDELFGDLVFNNCTFKSGKVQIGANADMTGTVTFNDCVFDTTSNTGIWSDKGIRVYSPAEFNDCEFNNRVVMAGSNGLAITFNSCTMNNGADVTDAIIAGSNVPTVTINN